MIMGLLLPTNKPRVFKEVLLPTLNYLEAAKDNINISINFQPPWTKEESEEIIESI